MMTKPDIALPLALLAVACGLAQPAPAAAQNAEATAAAIRIVAGYDDNPQLAPGADGAAFYDFSAAFAMAAQLEAGKVGLSLKGSIREYVDAPFASIETYRLTGVWDNEGGGGVAARAVSFAEYASDEDFRSFDAITRLRLGRAEGAARPFILGELRYSTLNEISVFGDFLPEDYRFGRVGATPGISFTFDGWEIGASVGFAATRYEETDLFGLDRDDERVQPALFLRHETQNMAFAASVSRFRAFWADDFFKDADRTLAEFSATLRLGSATLQLSAEQTPQETTFALSPAIIATVLEARLAFRPAERMVAQLWARDVDQDYLSAPISTRARLYGVGAAYDMGEGLVLGLETFYREGELAGGQRADGVTALFSVTGKIENGAGLPFADTGGGSSEVRRRVRPN